MYGHASYNPTFRPGGFAPAAGTCPHGERHGDCDRGACDEGWDE